MRGWANASILKGPRKEALHPYMHPFGEAYLGVSHNRSALGRGPGELYTYMYIESIT